MKQFVIPAILPASSAHLRECVRRVEDIVPFVQIDMVDGVFADATTYPFSTGGNASDAVRELNNLRIRFELDLMIQNPEETLAAWLESDPERCIIHFSSTNRLDRCAQMLREAGGEIYLGIGIEDNLNDIERVIGQVDGVQCMGIARIGRQGEVYDPRVEDIVRTLRTEHPEVPIVVDGGVSKKHIPALVVAGVSRVAVGSALFTGEVESNFSALTDAAR